MAWVKTAAGPINLDHVVKVFAQSNGDAYFYFDSTNYVSVSVAANQSDAKRIVELLTESLDPADYA